MFYKQTPVKITGYGLAAGCQVFYRIMYGIFLQYTIFLHMSTLDGVRQNRHKILYVKLRFFVLLRTAVPTLYLSDIYTGICGQKAVYLHGNERNSHLNIDTVH